MSSKVTNIIKNVHLMSAPSGIFNESNFHVYYDSAVIYHESEKKIFIGNKYKCRFCDESNPSKFKMTAHACPEFTGNKLFFSNDECDNCNRIFSKYETELSKESHFMRLLIGVKGKNAKISLKSNDKSLTFQHDDKGLICKIHGHKPDNQIYEKTEGYFKTVNKKTGRKNFIFKFKKTRYIPLFLFKALNKIAFSVMPQNELESGGFKRFKSWLREPHETFAEDELYKPYFYIYHNHIPYVTRKPLIMLFKKREACRNKSFPTFALLLIFGNSAYQIFLPFYKQDDSLLNSNEIFLPIIPEIMIEKEGKRKLTWMNGLSTEKTKIEDFKFILTKD